MVRRQVRAGGRCVAGFRGGGRARGQERGRRFPLCRSLGWEVNLLLHLLMSEAGPTWHIAHDDVSFRESDPVETVVADSHS
jgi:hypothetical protein